MSCLGSQWHLGICGKLQTQMSFSTQVDTMDWSDQGSDVKLLFH
jgi:hypothetical protein